MPKWVCWLVVAQHHAKTLFTLVPGGSIAANGHTSEIQAVLLQQIYCSKIHCIVNASGSSGDV